MNENKEDVFVKAIEELKILSKEQLHYLIEKLEHVVGNPQEANHWLNNLVMNYMCPYDDFHRINSPNLLEHLENVRSSYSDRMRWVEYSTPPITNELKTLQELEGREVN